MSWWYLPLPWYSPGTALVLLRYSLLPATGWGESGGGNNKQTSRHKTKTELSHQMKLDKDTADPWHQKYIRRQSSNKLCHLTASTSCCRSPSCLIDARVMSMFPQLGQTCFVGGTNLYVNAKMTKSKKIKVQKTRQPLQQFSAVLND